MRVSRACWAACLVLSLASPATARHGAAPQPASSTTEDTTGTNPLRLLPQVDVSAAAAELDALTLQTATYRQAVPLVRQRLRVAAAVQAVRSNVTGRSARGVGDVSADVEWVPWRRNARRGIVVGVRTTWDTARPSGLGLDAHTVMPYVQVVAASDRVVVAPWVGRRVGVRRRAFGWRYDDTMVGASLVWRPATRWWVGAAPHLVIDHAYGRTYGDLTAEVGVRTLERLAVVFRPAVGFGRRGEKPFDRAATVGVRWTP